MERFSGLLLMLAGAAMVGYASLPQTPGKNAGNVRDNQRSAAVAPAPQAETATRTSVLPRSPTFRPIVRVEDDEDEVRTFSPKSPAFRERARLVTAEPSPPSAAAAPAPTTAAAESKPGTWTTVVTAERAAATTLRSPKAGDRQTRYELAADLQRELKRVGCYGGYITGAWTRSTRAAMSAFMDRVNASLPIEEPDYILLTLVQSHDEIVCSATCPSEQIRTDAGRCVPRAVVAQASKKALRLQERRAAEARLAEARQRDRLTGADSSRALKSPETVATKEPEKLPWLDRNGRSVVAVTPLAPRSEPLPGRMSIGGPIAPQPPPSSVAASPRDWQTVPIRNRNDDNGRDVAATSGGASNAPAVAALADDDDPAVDDNEAGNPPSADDVRVPQKASGRSKHARPSRYRNPAMRPRPYYGSYGSSGRTRRGDPRPGTMRYNVAKALGGIY